MPDKERYVLVREDLLPEALLKTIEAKELLARGEVDTVHEAVERVELSRSAFYKYRDGVFPITKLDKERLATISMDLEHRSGILSRVLSLIAAHEANVLTINQTIPLQGMANVVISADTSAMQVALGVMIEAVRAVEGVRRASVIAQG